MGFNYNKEKLKFERQWIQKARQYRAAGMCCAQINAIYEFDYKLFLQRRICMLHSAEKLPDDFWEERPELETEDRYFQDIEEHLDVLLDELRPGLSEIATPRDTKMWQTARWINGMKAVQTCPIPGKTVVCGHWHASYGHSKYEGKGSEFGEDADFTPYMGKGIIAVDASTANSGMVNCIIIEDEEAEDEG